MKTLNINVTDNKIFINEPVEINTGEYRVTTVQFSFPTEWDGLIKKAKFGEYTETLVNNSCFFPIILRAGVVSIKVFGYREAEQNGETVMELVYSPQPTNIRINQGSYDYEQGDTPIVPEPDEEYLNKITLWGGYSTYFAALTDAPADAVAEFESVDISSMTLEEVVTEIEVINKMILDALADDVSDVLVNGHSVVTNHIANIPIPNTIVEDVKVNGSSVVDNNNVANISVPTNYVTTDTNQAITARKNFYWHSESGGVERSQTLEVFSADLNYYSDKIDGVNNINNSFIVSFPTDQNDGYIIIGKNNEECTYTSPKFIDGETYQLAVTDDITDTCYTKQEADAKYQTVSDVSTAIANNQFIVTYSKNLNDQWVCDKTFAEIEAAIQSKKEVLAIIEETEKGVSYKIYYAISARVPGSGIVFSCFDSSGQNVNGRFGIRSIGHTSSNLCLVNNASYDLNEKENVSNKVTTIDTSSPSITEYPSEKAVIDYIKSQRGKMRVVPPEKAYYCGTDGKIIDVTSSLSYVGNYYIDSTGNPVADGNNYCYALDLSQFASVSIKTATRSTSWYSYAFYTSGNNFISGGKLSNGSNNNQNVWNFETVNISNIPANAVKMLVVRYTATDNAIQNFFVKGKVKKSVVDCFDEWLTDEAPCAVIYKPAEAPTKIYRVGSGRTPSTTEFTSLIDAVTQWGTDGKPCATMFVDSGTYITQNDPTGASNPLSIVGGENRLTIIGEDKDATIVKSTTGKYVHPAINIQGGNVTIKNITFIADHSDNSTFAYLDPERQENGKTPNSAYAVHCDGGEKADVVSGVIEFDNCNMWSWQSCGLGCGTVVNGHVVVKNCDIRSFVPGTATDEGSTAQDATAEQKEAHALYIHGTRGAIVYHMSPKTKVVSGQNVTIPSSNESFTLINSNIYLKGGTKTVNVLNNSETDFFSLVTFIDNTFWNDTENCNLVPVPTGTTNVHLGGLSGGNNVETVNSNSSDYSLLIK